VGVCGTKGSVLYPAPPRANWGGPPGEKRLTGLRLSGGGGKSFPASSVTGTSSDFTAILKGKKLGFGELVDRRSPVWATSRTKDPLALRHRPLHCKERVRKVGEF